MSLLPVMTLMGRTKLLAAQGGGTTVVLSSVTLGSAARAPTGAEQAVTTPICSGPIATSFLDPDAIRLDLGVMLDGAVVGLSADHVVREVGFFDQDGDLIFYWSTLDSLGSITPLTAYALNLSVTLSAADAGAIEIIDQGPPWDAIIGLQMAALEARTRRASFRNLFLAQA